MPTSGSGPGAPDPTRARRALPLAAPDLQAALAAHQEALRQCRQCPDMHPPSIVGAAVRSPVMILGQAPGRHEGELGRPFAWTAGKTLFQWFARIGLPEEAFRQRVYMAAVCRCFPGPQPRGGGDRVPSRAEIERCHAWLAAEIALLTPRLLIPVGRLAIAQIMSVDNLVDVIGRQHRVRLAGHELDAIPLPHPSGVSSWHRTAPGKDLLEDALRLIAGHEAFAGLIR
jgi:uracil-DNA glycosylase